MNKSVHSLKGILHKIPIPLQITLKVYLLGMGIFSLFRIILFLFNWEDTQAQSLTDVLTSLFIGMRFDTTISCYILAVPLVVLLTNYYLLKWNKFLFLVSILFIAVLYTLSFAVEATDIPFFNHFFDRLNISVFLWNNNADFALDMLFKEWEYLGSFLLFLSVSFLFYRTLIPIYKKYSVYSKPANTPLIELTYTLVFLTIFFFSLRGKINFDVPPLDTRDAYHSTYPFANKITLNPVFTLLRSLIDSLDPKNKTLHLIDNEKAVKNVQHYLQIKEQKYDSPIARDVVQHSKQQPNVVLILMESMTRHKMGRYGNPLNLTPNLDSLAKNGLAFDKIYSAGIHTYNGIFSTLFSFPAVYRKQPLKTSPIKEYYGLPQVLKEKGYNTNFFITHDELFDNVGAFLRANGFDRVYSEKDYPQDKILGTWGVPDDYLFEFGTAKLNELAQAKHPFLSVFLTCSDHSPYVIPSYFQPKNNNVSQQIVEYADWSIGQFLKSCSKQDWFDNTLFVFVADHGQPMNVVYDMPLAFNQIPFIIYAPDLIHPESIDNLGLQVDVFPSIMGVLEQSYINNTLGINLREQKREFAFFSADDKIGVLNDSLFLIHYKDENEYLYNYKNKNTTSIYDKYPKQVEKMKKYAFSFIQATDWLTRQNKQRKPQLK